MVRHFLTLYLLIVATLAAASWGQERLWELYGRQSATADRAYASTLALVEEQLRSVPGDERPGFVSDLAARTRVDLELFELQDIAGEETISRLERGEPAFMSAGNGQAWMLKRLRDDGRVLAFRYRQVESRRGALEWTLAFLFYAAIALVIMVWLWPLTRDLRRLEKSTAAYGNRNWTFDAAIRPTSQIYPLAKAFRRMAERIDTLISSHKDMSNAVAHDIKTPLARMRFEIEMARVASSPGKLAEHLDHINTDIAELDGFVKAALDYAILERAEVALNIGCHDFTHVLPAVTESVRRGAQRDLDIRCEVRSDATSVSCDAHLVETLLRNLLYNAIRFARSEVRIDFREQPDGLYSLQVDDDGPGIPEADRKRVFGSFVQLGSRAGGKAGYGLGLAIVKRVVEWHGGEVSVSRSALGGACFLIRWPAARPAA